MATSGSTTIVHGVVKLRRVSQSAVVTIGITALESTGWKLDDLIVVEQDGDEIVLRRLEGRTRK